MRVLLTGPTGTAGSATLLVLLADPGVTSVTALSRRPIDTQHEKLRVVLHDDFTDPAPLASLLAETDALLWCLGIGQNDVPEAEYIRITYDYTLAFARALLVANPKATFIFLSGQGSDPTERSRALFGRIKGRTERAVDGLGLARLHHARPGYIHPTTEKPSRKALERFSMFVEPLFRALFPRHMIDADQLGRALLAAARGATEERVLDNVALQRLAAGAP
ncbi:NAD-dependent epimerase/dehydratase family protein [Myxococcota bacterium]|nr:NAD-dependent epimerase/dehydratase family protein [Myxococcota bacterium]